MTEVVDVLERGRKSYERRAWADTHEALEQADRSAPLGPEDLERLATSAYMLGRADEYLTVLERAHRANLDAARRREAFRCAFWVGLNLARAGDTGPAGGWLARAERLLDQEPDDCVERGYMLLPAVFEKEARGDWTSAAATAGQAAAIGERFGDRDLSALAGHERGHTLIRAGRVEEGLRLLDEAMVAATSEELSPIVTGIVYCGVILACQEAHDVHRARQWTTRLTSWCERQPEMVAFTGRCLIHRAEVMQVEGAWERALAEARRAGERCLQGENRSAEGEAQYRQGEIHRLLGELEAAEAAYEKASRRGREPQPGLALLRLAQGRSEAGAAAIRRVEAEAAAPGRRASLLPAFVEIMLAVGDLDAAHGGSEQLARLADDHPSTALQAMAAYAGGATSLAANDPPSALVQLRRAEHAWRDVGAPYETARARELIALACRKLGDEDTARLEREAAREAFQAVGAAIDLARLDAAAAQPRHGLTDRELEVLRLVSAGVTNKTIAAELVLSERTVDRHVSNIFAKIRVSSRAAATAYAYEHGLV